MEDMWETVQQFLQNEDSMQQLQQMAEQFGLGDMLSSAAESGESAVSPEDSSFLEQLLSQFTDDTAHASSSKSSGGFSFGPEMWITLQKILAKLNQEDNNTKLLRALKPHCSPPKQKKVDQAVQLLRLMSILPALQESGLLGGLFHEQSDS